MDHVIHSGDARTRLPNARGVALRRPGRAASIALIAVLLTASGCALLPSRSGSGAGTVEIISHTVSPGVSTSIENWSW